ncbi:hypothetical protein CEQ90_11585 [Lewinellaceae bacterium SD302]|nr:hypothetical protein CEQ90_11585 [Lewinellaceae bacterium SD302]
MHSPRAHYIDEQEKFEAEAARLRTHYNRLSYARLLIFFLLVALVILLWSYQWYFGLAGALIFLPLFAYGVKKHQAIYRASAMAEHLAAISASELMALEHEFDIFDGGQEFLDLTHSYAADLDLFGPHSLFQYLNRCVTAVGKRWLADALLEAAPTSVVLERQAAIRELGQEPEWCHIFRARGADLEDDPQYLKRLQLWLEEPELVYGTPLLRAARWFVPLFFVLTVVGLFMLPNWQMALFGLIPVALVMRKFGEEISRVHTFTAQAGSVLSYYADLLEQIEATDWESPLLQKLQKPILGQGRSASSATRQLRYAISQLDVRYNAFSALLEVSGLWSVQWIARLERWRREHRKSLPAWFESLAEIDALVSLANLHFNRPDFAFADVHQEHCYFASHLGHPLLEPKSMVTNDLNIETDGHIHLVTGSNMAGKSTWLRTVGINVVLALCGAPVCASEMRLPQMQVWTSMRTQDALHESTSSFFAELKRLKAIIAAVEAKEKQVFFLLDEILKGTNSRDRHVGARALIRQLIQSKGAGIIATHDLELAEMENEVGSRVENYAMEIQTEGQDMVFDYKLRAGVCKSFNATLLMAKMGIAIPAEEVKIRKE